MANINKEITLTEKNDAGPYFDIYWSSNCSSYNLLSSNVFLPTVGSSTIVSVDDTVACIKLVSKGQCVNEVVSGSTTTTTTQAPITPISGAAWWSGRRDTESISGNVQWTDPYTGTLVTRFFGTSATRYVLSTTKPVAATAGMNLVGFTSPTYVDIFPTASFDLTTTTEYRVTNTGNAQWGYFSYYDTDTCQWVIAEALNFTEDPYTINAATDTLVYDYPNWSIEIISSGSSQCNNPTTTTTTTTTSGTTTTTTTTTTVAPGVYLIELGYSQDSIADACTNSTISQDPYYINSSEWSSATQLWLDAGGTQVAPPGFYAYNNGIWKYWNTSTFSANGNCTS